MIFLTVHPIRIKLLTIWLENKIINLELSVNRINIEIFQLPDLL